MAFQKNQLVSAFEFSFPRDCKVSLRATGIRIQGSFVSMFLLSMRIKSTMLKIGIIEN